MSFDLPDTITVADYAFDERAFLKMAHILHVLKSRYPNWTFKVASVSHCSIVIQLPFYTRYRFNTYENYYYIVGFRGKRPLEHFFQHLDQKYAAEFGQSEDNAP